MAQPMCERVAPTVAKVVKDGGYDTVAFTASAFGKDVVWRVAAKLGAGYAPDINQVKVDGASTTAVRSTPATPSRGSK